MKKTQAINSPTVSGKGNLQFARFRIDSVYHTAIGWGVAITTEQSLVATRNGSPLGQSISFAVLGHDRKIGRGKLSWPLVECHTSLVSATFATARVQQIMEPSAKEEYLELSQTVHDIFIGSRKKTLKYCYIQTDEKHRGLPVYRCERPFEDHQTLCNLGLIR